MSKMDGDYQYIHKYHDVEKKKKTTEIEFFSNIHIYIYNIIKTYIL